MVVISQCDPVFVRGAPRPQEAVTEHGQAVIDEARAAAQQVGDQLKDKAGEAACELKSSAQESAERVKEEAPTSSATVSDGTHGSPSDLNRRARHDTGHSCFFAACRAREGAETAPQGPPRGRLPADRMTRGEPGTHLR